LTALSTLPIRLRKDRFRDNAFAVLGLPFGASQNEIRQRAQQRSVELDLRGATQEDRERIGQALHILEDPRLRLEEEVYWVHLMPDPIPADFSFENKAEMWDVQVRLLELFQAGSDEAAHDLALIRLAIAQETRTSLTDWLAALMSWRRAIDNNSIWARVDVRAGFADDARVSAEFVASLREGFRSTGIEVFADALLTLIAEGADDDAEKLFRALTTTEDGWVYSIGSVDALLPALRTLEVQLRDAINSRQLGDIPSDQLSSFWETRAQEVVRLGQRYYSWVQVDYDLVGPLDDTALWLRGLSVRLHNEADRTDLAVDVVDRALEIAVSATTIANLEDARKQLLYQLAQRRAFQCAEQEQWKGAQAYAAEALVLAPDSDRARLLEFQATCVARQRSMTLAPRPANAAVAGPASLAIAVPARSGGRKWPWAVAAGVVGLIVLAIMNSGSSTFSSNGASSTSCQTQKSQLKGQVDSLDSQISSSQAWLSSENASLTSESSRLTQNKATIDRINARLAAGYRYNTAAEYQQFQNYVAQYNSDVGAYNQRLAVRAGRLTDYNSMVQQRSTLADQYNGLSC
jgi:hypothetical protein